MTNLIEPPKEYPVPAMKVASDLPEFPIPEGYNDSDDYLKHLVGGDGIGSREFHNRLSFELDVIKSHEGTANYLLIMWDLVRAAREQFQIHVGPGRSSVAGSLVCYQLGITQVDPLDHDLLFERFISPDRNVLPDIDIEVEDGSKDILIGYLKDKYGEQNVTNIITYIRAKDKDRSIVGHGVHACGVALSRWITEYYCPLTKVNNTVVTIYDGLNIEDAGPVKIDILELHALKQIHEICRLIDAKGCCVDINMIPTDDKSTLEAFGNAETKGVFYFESEKLKDYLLHMQVPTFNDLVALNTMYRPGIMEMIPEYINRQSFNKSIQFSLPCMEKYLKGTYGLLLYQEQLMLLLRQIAGFSRAESDMCRKALGKKKEDLLAKYKQKFIEGGANMGHPQETLEGIWSDWCNRGLYLFNKSHAVCYTFIAYQMMYLKVHYPDEFHQVMNDVK